MPDVSFLASLREADEVEIETVRADGTARRTVIWAVADDRAAYVRSVRGGRGRWYRDLVARPDGALHVAGRRIEVRAVAAADPATVELVSALLREKYGRRSRASTDAMLLPDPLPTTMRLELR